MVCVHIHPSLSLSRRESVVVDFERTSWYLVEWVSLRTPSQPFILGFSGPRLRPFFFHLLSPLLSLSLFLLSVLSRPRSRRPSFIPGLPPARISGLSVPCVCVRLMCPKAIRRAAGSLSSSTLSAPQLKCVFSRVFTMK